MTPGWAGTVAGTTESVLAVPGPQMLLAFTVMVPAEGPVTTLMETVDEVPVQPEGKVQVYEVAPGTTAMLYVCGVP